MWHPWPGPGQNLGQQAVKMLGADPGGGEGGGGGVLAGKDPPPPLGGPQKFIKRETRNTVVASISFIRGEQK